MPNRTEQSGAPKYFYFGKTVGEGSYGTVFECVEIPYEGGKVNLAVKRIQMMSKTETSVQPLTEEEKEEKVEERKSKVAECTRSEKCGEVSIHFPKVHHWCVTDDAAYLVMDKAEGDLHGLMWKPVKWTLRNVLLLLENMAEALVTLERLRIGHFDVTPKNILVQMEGEEDWVFLLTDFGSSQEADPDGTWKRPPSFTCGYAAPELIKVLPTTCAADVWSLGAVLSELLTGHFPTTDNDDWAGINFPDGVPDEVVTVVK